MSGVTQVGSMCHGGFVACVQLPQTYVAVAVHRRASGRGSYRAEALILLEGQVATPELTAHFKTLQPSHAFLTPGGEMWGLLFPTLTYPSKAYSTLKLLAGAHPAHPHEVT